MKKTLSELRSSVQEKETSISEVKSELEQFKETVSELEQQKSTALNALERSQVEHEGTIAELKSNFQQEIEVCRVCLAKTGLKRELAGFHRIRPLSFPSLPSSSVLHHATALQIPPSINIHPHPPTHSRS